jgi:hypothetical protein
VLEILVQSWLLLTGVCLALLALVISAQWSLATARRLLTGVQGILHGSLHVSVAEHVPAAPPRLYSVAGK